MLYYFFGVFPHTQFVSVYACCWMCVCGTEAVLLAKQRNAEREHTHSRITRKSHFVFQVVCDQIMATIADVPERVCVCERMFT